MENPSGKGENGEEELEKLVKEYQLLEEQIRGFTLQLQEMQLQKSEAENARSEVEKATGKIYLTIGGVIVETDKEKALSNLKEKSESLELRIQMINKQLSSLKSREEAIKRSSPACSNNGGFFEGFELR